MTADRALLELLSEVIANLEGDVSLEVLAARAGLSPHHLHRSFKRLVGETPKQYTQRLRLEWAAAELACTERSVLEVALAAGFVSHTRAFRRHLGRPPARYRSEALAGASPESRLAEAAPGEGDIEAGTLPGGVAAMAVHVGAYEGLPHQTHAAIERWIEANGANAGGPPWESYITDPGETPAQRRSPGCERR
jgi:AraC-like DNA-binding protein